MLEEGVPAAMIENISKNKGMPVGPLAVIDEVSLSLGMHVYESDPSSEKAPYMTRFYKIEKLLVDTYGREGKRRAKVFMTTPKVVRRNYGRNWPLCSIVISIRLTLKRLLSEFCTGKHWKVSVVSKKGYCVLPWMVILVLS